MGARHAADYHAELQETAVLVLQTRKQLLCMRVSVKSEPCAADSVE